jgi:hypothetical protein
MQAEAMASTDVRNKVAGPVRDIWRSALLCRGAIVVDFVDFAEACGGQRTLK